ncbi:MAG TPA: hypothetical protein VI248_05455 [Kineosporiaceae bacterium]
MTGSALRIEWLPEPEKHDYPAALDYLSLLVPQTAAEALVASLRTAHGAQRKAKDILRASQLPELPATNAHVRKDLHKITEGTPLSPVLLVADQPLIIADGYHRVCAVYHLDEDAVIPCRLVPRSTD